jgi:hypothetical protein
MQEAAERAFRDNTVQPFSAAELASIGYVDVPAAERFTFGVHLCNRQRAACKMCFTCCGEARCLYPAFRHALCCCSSHQPHTHELIEPMPSC